MFSSTATGKHKCRCYCQHSFAIAGARAYMSKWREEQKLLVGNTVCFLGEVQILHLMTAWHQAGAGGTGEHKMDYPVAFLCHHVTPPLQVLPPFSKVRRLGSVLPGTRWGCQVSPAWVWPGDGTARQWTLGRRTCKCKETSVYCKLVWANIQ